MFRPLGLSRVQNPVNLISLHLFAVEHTTRHMGQFLVTVRCVYAFGQNPGLCRAIPHLSSKYSKIDVLLTIARNNQDMESFPITQYLLSNL